MAGQRVPRTHAGKTWTKARYFSFIRSALRRAASNYPVKYQVKDQARRVKPKGKEGRHRFEYHCAHCNEWFPDKEVEVDHIIGAGSLKEYTDLPGFVERLFCEPRGMQILCKPCHQLKTNDERRARK